MQPRLSSEASWWPPLGSNCCSSWRQTWSSSSTSKQQQVGVTDFEEGMCAPGGQQQQ
jgi:hypothetical protein